MSKPYVRVNLCIPSASFKALQQQAKSLGLQPGTLAKQLVMAGVAK